MTAQILALTFFLEPTNHTNHTNEGLIRVIRVIRPVAEIVFPDKAQAILQFTPAPELQARIEELAEKSTEGLLSEAERAEYEGYVRANKFIAILQRLARQIVAPQS